jgi:hypothetical protein
LTKIKEREQKQALRDQQDQQRRIERQRRDEIEKQRRDEAAAQYLLHQKAIAEARRTQDAENHRLVEQQRLARQTERERKQLLRDQQDQQRRLARQAQDTACMQALLRHEAVAKAKRAQEAEERELERLTEKERLAEGQGLARLREGD